MDMDFNEYQKQSRKTALYLEKDLKITYPILGLCGETGEVAEKFKKLYRDSNGMITPEFLSPISPKSLAMCSGIYHSLHLTWIFRLMTSPKPISKKYFHDSSETKSTEVEIIGN